MKGKTRLYRALLDALQRRQITQTARTVGEALVRRSNLSGACWPSQATLAAESGCSIRQVIRSLRQLKALGFLVWRRRWNRSTRRRETNVYRLLGLAVIALQQPDIMVSRNSPAVLSLGDWTAREDDLARENARRQLALLGFAC